MAPSFHPEKVLRIMCQLSHPEKKLQACPRLFEDESLLLF